jgi:hypothetical protein
MKCLSINMTTKNTKNTKENKPFLVRDNGRTLFYQALRKVRQDGVCATLVGYWRAGKEYWY